MNTVLTKIPKTIPVSAFRAGLADHLAATKHAPVIISGRRGGETYVLLDSAVYNELLEVWEDEQASRTLARLVKRDGTKKFVPFKPDRK